MSFFLEQDENKNPGLQNPTAPLPQSAASSGQGAQTTAGTGSGSFTDIRKYLDANKGAAEGMGEKIGQNVQTQLTDQENQAKGLNDTFTQDVNLQNPSLSQDEIKNAAANPTAFVSGQGNTEKFGDVYNKTYGGPTAPVDTSAQSNKVNELSDLTKSSGGRQELLKGIYKQPEKATGGQYALDNALIQGTPNAIKAVTDKQGEAQRITDALTANRATQQQQISDVQKTIGDRKMDIDNYFWQNPDSAYNTLQKTVDSKTAAAQKAADKGASTALNAFNLDKLGNIYMSPTHVDHYDNPIQSSTVDPKKLTITDSALKMLGINKQEYADILGAINLMNTERKNAMAVNKMQDKSGKKDAEYADRAKMGPLIDSDDIKSYFKNLGTSGITASNVANSADYGELSALKQLLGEKNPQLDFGYLKSPTKAGKYNSDIVNTNEKGLLDYIFKELSKTDTDYDYGAHASRDDDYRSARSNYVSDIKRAFDKYRKD